MTQETTGDIVDDVISQKDVDAVFSPEIDVTPEPPVQSAPQPQPEGAPLPEGLPDNDQVRYAYWQSQADKKDNRIKELEGTVGTLQSAFQTVAPQQEAVKEPEVEKFPDPPEKPQRPRNFSRQEAMEDAGSNRSVNNSRLNKERGRKLWKLRSSREISWILCVQILNPDLVQSIMISMISLPRCLIQSLLVLRICGDYTS